jgi:hypothetical protein
MSDIKVGDLVMVVKPSMCCGNPIAMGVVFVAGRGDADLFMCRHCGHKYQGIDATYNASSGYYFATQRLKRIPPISELEGARDALSERNKTEA